MSKAEPITVAQIGCGYWGPNLLRNFSAIDGCRVKYVVDSSEERRQFVRSNWPATKAVSSVDEVLDDPEVAAVVVVTPVEQACQGRRRHDDRR